MSLKALPTIASSYLVAFLSVLICAPGVLRAQQTVLPPVKDHHEIARTPGALPILSITGAAGEKAVITAAEMATLPRKTVAVFDAHTNAQETFSGVLLSDVLTRVNAPLGENLHGRAMSIRVLAEGADHYTAIYSLAEVDPAFHSGSVIIADIIDGQTLPPSHGPLQLVNTEDKRPARWVRQLVAIKLISEN